MSWAFMENASHQKLQRAISTIFRYYGFEIENNVQIPSPFFPRSCFEAKTELDIYIHTLPFFKKGKTRKNTNITARDFIVECKTGKNLDDEGEKQILAMNKFFPTYVAFPRPASQISKEILHFLDVNHIGLMTYDAEQKKLMIVKTAYSKLGCSFLEGAVQEVPHSLFQIFGYKRKNRNQMVCLPFAINIDRNDDNKTYVHKLKRLYTWKGFIGLRNRFISEFEKQGFEAAESWAIYYRTNQPGITYQGYDIQSLRFALDQLHDNFNRMREKKHSFSDISKIEFRGERFNWLWPSFEDTFEYCISMEKGVENALLTVDANIQYSKNEQTDFGYYPQILSDEELYWIPRTRGIQTICSDKIDFKHIDFENKIFDTKNLRVILALTKKYTSERKELDSINPTYYHYDDGKNKLVVRIHNSMNYEIWQNTHQKFLAGGAINPTGHYTFYSQSFQKAIDGHEYPLSISRKPAARNI